MHGIGGRARNRLKLTLKAELVADQQWSTRAAARTAICEWLDVFYNRQRCHSALAYRSLVAHEERVLLLQDLAV